MMAVVLMVVMITMTVIKSTTILSIAIAVIIIAIPEDALRRRMEVPLSGSCDCSCSSMWSAGFRLFGS